MPALNALFRMHARQAILAVTAALVLLMIQTAPSHALPLFARKYNMPCTSCHIAAPRLNLFGMHFKQNGYRMPGSEGESPWDSTGKSFPLSLVGNVAYHVGSTSTDNGGASRDKFTTSAFEQEQVEFHTAGTLAKQVTFHFDNDFSGEGGTLNSGMAFAQYDDLMKDGVLNVKAGIFDADTPYLADSRKTTLTEYLSPVTLGASGVELNGTHSGWMYAGGLINSSRSADSALAHKPGAKSFNQLENTYVWLTREMGSNMLTARVFLDHQDPRTANATSSGHMQAELNAFVDRGRFFIIPGYTYETFQDEPAGISDKLQTGLIEALWLLDKDSRWVLTTRYEHQYTPKSNGATAVMDRSLGAMNVAYYINPNARIGVDWAHGSDNVHGPITDDVRAFFWLGY